MLTTPSRMTVKLESISHSLRRKPSMAGQITEAIRNLITNGDLNPGDRVVESRIARELGVGQPTVREALVALEHQGLVFRKANQGCVVTSLSRGEIAQGLRIRAELEVLAVELAVENAPDEEIRGLLEITAKMKAAARQKSVQRFFTEDLLFHKALWVASGNIFLPKVLSQVMLPLLAFLYIRNLRHHSIDMVASAEAHDEIVDGILTRDKNRARQIAQQHFRKLEAQHLELYESGGERR
jgi:DNA-binding GntR family transcriptional regulator